MEKFISLSDILSFKTYKDKLTYIDPGTGSVIISSIWLLIVAFFSTVAAFLVKYFWNPIKRIFSKFKKIMGFK